MVNIMIAIPRHLTAGEIGVEIEIQGKAEKGQLLGNEELKVVTHRVVDGSKWW